MIPAPYAAQTHAMMRIAFALIFLNYGLQKFGFFGGVDGQGASAPFLGWPFGVAGVIEVVAGTPVQNNGQAAVLLCFGFLYLAARGAGIWSVDAARAAAPSATARV